MQEIKITQKEQRKFRKQTDRINLEIAEIYARLSELDEDDQKAVLKVLDPIKTAQTIEEGEEIITRTKALFAEIKGQSDFRKSIKLIREEAQKYAEHLNPQDRNKIEQNLELLENSTSISDDDKTKLISECRTLINGIKNKEQREEKTIQQARETLKTLREIAERSSPIYRHEWLDLIVTAETLIAQNARLSKIEYAVEKAVRYAKEKKLFKE